MTPEAAAGLLLAARRDAAAAPWRHIVPADRSGAYAVQDATLARLGPAGGWKVGAKGPQLEPLCAPLPAAGLLASGSRLVGPAWRLRGVEVEVALRLGRDLDPGREALTPALLVAACDAVLPAIEVVETRLDDWPDSDRLAQLADLQSHGALVIGEPAALAPAQLDLRSVQACLLMDGQPVAHTRGANPALDVWRLVDWLANHCSARGQALRAGTVITTGSCTGMLFAAAGTRVQAELTGIGRVELFF